MVSSDPIIKQVSNAKAAWLFAGIIVFGLVLRLAVFAGYVGIDDITYITDAYRFSEGRFDATPYHGTARLGMVGTLAIIFKVFGTSLFAVAITPLLWSLTSIVLAYVTGKIVYNDLRVALLGAFFVAVYPLDVIYATQYFPDVGAATLMWVAFLFFFVAERQNKNFWYLAAGLALGLAYLYKETALFALLPLCLYVLYRRRWRNGFLATAAGFAIVVAIEMATFGVLFDDPLFRVQSLAPKTVSTAHTSKAAFDEVRPGGIWFSPAVSLVTNQEYGLFFFFIPVSAIALIKRRDKATMPLLLFFLAVGLYMLWGPLSLKVYKHLRPLERYLLPITIPGMLLLARWIWLCLRGKWRWAVATLLVASWLVCIHVDNSFTFRSIGDKLRAFRDEHDEMNFVMHPHAYMSLFIANGLEPPTNVAILEWKKESGYARRVDPNIRVFSNKAELANCYVAVVQEEGAEGKNRIPTDWQEVASCMRDRRWYVQPLASIGGLAEAIGNKLSPSMGYLIYRMQGTQTERVQEAD